MAINTDKTEAASAHTHTHAQAETALSAPTAKAPAPKHVVFLFWGALALAALLGMLLPLALKTTPEYVVEQYLMLALVPILAYTLYRAF